MSQPETEAESFSRSGQHWRVLVLGFLIIGSGTIAGYIFNYMSTFGQNTLHISTTISMAGEFANQGISIGLALVGGLLADRFGRRPVMIWPQLAFCFAILPSFLWLISERSAVSFIGGNMILSALTGLQYSAVYVAISESLPREIRGRSFALVYSLPVAILGGTTQLVVTWLLRATGQPISIAWYLTAVSVVGLVAMWLMPESAPGRAASARHRDRQ